VDAWARSHETQERTGVIGIAGNGWWPPMAVVVMSTMIPSSLRPKDVFADEKRLYGHSTRRDNAFFHPFSPRVPVVGSTTTGPVAGQRVRWVVRCGQEVLSRARTSSAYFSSFEGPTPGMRARASASAGIASAIAVRVASVKTT